MMNYISEIIPKVLEEMREAWKNNPKNEEENGSNQKS